VTRGNSASPSAGSGSNKQQPDCKIAVIERILSSQHASFEQFLLHQGSHESTLRGSLHWKGVIKKVIPGYSIDRLSMTVRRAISTPNGSEGRGIDPGDPSYTYSVAEAQAQLPALPKKANKDLIAARRFHLFGASRASTGGAARPEESRAGKGRYPSIRRRIGAGCVPIARARRKRRTS
jgi:hypothetical protein